jgi:hypothetical protein
MLVAVAPVSNDELLNCMSNDAGNLWIISVTET